MKNTSKFLTTLITLALLFASLPAQPIQAVTQEIEGTSASEELLQFSAAGHVLGFSEQAFYSAAGDHMLRVAFANTVGVTPQAAQSAAVSEGQIQPLGTVTYADLWTGITLHYSAASDSILESTYHLAAGADVSQIHLQYNMPVEVNANGSLSIAYETGTMTESAPVAWQEIDGQHVAVEAAFEKLDEQELGFTLGTYNRSYPLVIDPTLTWNTFLGSSGMDDGFGITVDSSGNVFLAGRSEDSWGSPLNAHAGGKDAFVAKLNSSGVLQWHTFLGSAGSDRAIAVAVDGSGNIIISGYSNSAWGSPVVAHAGGNDVFVAKLNSSGALQWNTFMGSSGDDETYGGLVIDASDNIFLSGQSDTTWGTPVTAYAGSGDAFVAKLNSSGALQWHTFLGSSSQGDQVRNIAIDGSGNVFLGGGSGAAWGTSPIVAYAGGWEAFVAKLNSSGELQWNTFTGSSGDDWCGGIALDSSNNIYTTGGSYASWGKPLNAHAGGADVFAAKLNSSGALQWHTFMGSSSDDFTYEGASIGVDGSDNFYIYGVSEATWGSPVTAHAGDRDPFVAELNSNGALQWHTFMGTEWDDGGMALAVDSSGNSYVTGYSWDTWGESPVNDYAGAQDIFAVKYNGSGALLWNTFMGASGKDYGSGIAVDGSGNVYVSGASFATWGSPLNAHAGGQDAFVAKLNSSGALLWNTFLGSSIDDRAMAIALDGGGNIYVLGWGGWGDANWGSPIVPHAGGNDVFVAKLNSSGVLQWNTFLGSAGDDKTYGGLTVDASGNVFLTGSSDTAWGTPVTSHAGGWDAFAAKLNNSGTLQWNTFLGSSVENEHGMDIAVDGSGNVFVGGISYATWGSPIVAYAGGGDAFIAKLNSSGALQWNTFMGSSGEDWCDGIVLDSSSNIYVAGESDATWGSPLNAHAGDFDVYAAKLNSSGVLLWHTFMGSTGADHVYNGASIGVDGSDNVYVNGNSDVSWGSPVTAHAGDMDPFVAELNSNGALLWHTFMGTEWYDGGWAMAVDSSGNSYVTGNSLDTWGSPVNEYTAGREAFVVKLGNNPVVVSVTRTDPSPTNAASVDFSVTFSEAVTGVDTADFSLTTTGAVTGASVTAVSGSGDTYTVGVNTGSGDGTIRLDVNASGTGIEDLGGNPLNGGFTSGETYTLQRSPVFTDVPLTHWAVSYIENIYFNGITSGCGSGAYCPSDPVTRAQMAVFLLRSMHGSEYIPPPASGTVFADVSLSHWAARWIEQFATEGITSGCGGGNYCPNDPVTRAQMAVFLLRAKHGSSYVPPPATGVFNDVPVSFWAVKWIEQLAAEGITSGCGGGNYCPNAPVNRDQMAVFLVKTFNMVWP